MTAWISWSPQPECPPEHVKEGKFGIVFLYMSDLNSEPCRRS